MNKVGRRTTHKGLRFVLSERIKMLRLKSGLNQAQFGEAFDVSVQTVSAWENGRRMPEIDRVVDIAVGFNISTDWLLGIK